MTAKSDWPDLAGKLVEGGHVLPVRIYFEDTDFSGVVYHAAFLRFMERGRSDMVRLMGVNHEALAKGDYGEPLAFAVRRIEVDFFRPARIDDLIEIHTKPVHAGGARLILEQQVKLGEAVLVAAKVTIVMINLEGKARRMPATLRSTLGIPDE
jgi:acyl-CoA thioester hydrolase